MKLKRSDLAGAAGFLLIAAAGLEPASAAEGARGAQNGVIEASPCLFADAALHAFRKEGGRIIGRSWREVKTKTQPARQGFYILDKQGRFLEIAVLDICKRSYQATVVIESPYAERKFTLQESGPTVSRQTVSRQTRNGLRPNGLQADGGRPFGPTVSQQASERALLYYDPHKKKSAKELTVETENRPDFIIVKIKEAGKKQPVKLYVSRYSGRVALSEDLMNDATFHFGCSTDLGFIPQIEREGGRKILSVHQKGERIYEVRFIKSGASGKPFHGKPVSGKLKAQSQGRGKPGAKTSAGAGAQTDGGAAAAAETVLQIFKIPSQSCLIERWMRWGPRAARL